MLEVKSRYIVVRQQHTFSEKHYTLCWRARCDYSPRVGEHLNVGCLEGKVNSVANTIFNEGLFLDGNEVIPSKLVWKTTVVLVASPFKNLYNVEEIFEHLHGASSLFKIDPVDASDNSWTSTIGWSSHI
jgi:hypothetical protein